MLDRIFSKRTEARNSTTAVSFTDWAKMYAPGSGVMYNGRNNASFQLSGGSTSAGASFYDTNSVVFACELNRMLLFSEARFQFQQMRGGRPGDLYGTGALSVLERPWENGTTRDLLVRAELDVATSGNSYWVLDDAGHFLRLDPSKVTILLEGVGDPVYGHVVGERLLGYSVMVDTRTSVIYAPSEVFHYAPIPDRTCMFRGMSWLNPCLADIAADASMTQHKLQQTTGGAQLGYVVTMDPTVTQEQFEAFMAVYKREHEGPQNAGKTLFLAGGADVKTVGQTFEQMAFKATQGAGETRIAACAGVPPVIVGLSEGLSSATYSNYSQARRRLVDGTMRPLWGAVAGALQTLVPPPSGSRLWYDDRDIPFLREDVKDQAEIQLTNSSTIAQLITAGYEPDTVTAAVAAGDLTMLKHTGLYSVQLQPAMPDGPPDPTTPPVSPKES